jgi:amino acid permease
MSCVGMLLSITPFYVASLAKEQLPEKVEMFFIITMLLSFIVFAFSLILPIKKRERIKEFDEL